MLTLHSHDCILSVWFVFVLWTRALLSSGTWSGIAHFYRWERGREERKAVKEREREREMGGGGGEEEWGKRRAYNLLDDNNYKCSAVQCSESTWCINCSHYMCLYTFLSVRKWPSMKALDWSGTNVYRKLTKKPHQQRTMIKRQEQTEQTVL